MSMDAGREQPHLPRRILLVRPRRHRGEEAPQAGEWVCNVLAGVPHLVRKMSGDLPTSGGATPRFWAWLVSVVKRLTRFQRFCKTADMALSTSTDGKGTSLGD